MLFDYRLIEDEARLRAALEASDGATLAMVLVQLTGDAGILDEIAPFIRGPWDYSENFPPHLRQMLHERMIKTLKHYAAHDLPLPASPPARLLQKMMSVCVGDTVSDEYAPMMLEEMALGQRDPKGVGWRRKPADEVLRKFHVIVIGAGMSGLCAAIKLQQAGIAFTVFEKNDTVGGTWHENSYPGCGVDTPNHFYSYSFEPAYHWTHYFSKRDELHRYFENCADKYRLREHIRFKMEVLAAGYLEERSIWQVRVRDAQGAGSVHEASAVICAVGQLNRPSIPDIPGRQRFQGPAFHTGQWQHGHDLKNKRVAIIGTGASAMQVVPAIAPEAARLFIFQRSPHWAVMNPNYQRSVAPELQWLLRYLPFYAKWYRFRLFWGFGDGLHGALQKDPAWPDAAVSLNAVNEKHRRSIVKFIGKEIGDNPELLAKVIPGYPPYGKRMLIDNGWYRTLLRDNVELITDGIEEITENGILSRAGDLFQTDIIVFATGFQAARMLWPVDIKGRGGRTIRELWGDDDPRAYLGITIPGFPNFFVLYGPNTNLGHGGSIIFHAECQIRYTMKCLRELIESGRSSMEIRRDVHDAYNKRVDEAHQRMVWTHEGMDNWYKNSRGRVITNSPWRLVDYWKMTAEPDIAEYRVK